MKPSLVLLSCLSCLVLASPLFAGASPTPTPEPATFALVGAAAGALLLAKHFLKNKRR
jgi:hypothetical protein